MIKIGVDCHKLEDSTAGQRAGIGRHTYKLLEEISKRPELKDKFKFYLYFKGEIPKDIPFLNNKIFVKKIAKLPYFFPFFRPSFNIYFHIALPIHVFNDKLDVVYFNSFMHPAFLLNKSILVLTNDVYHEYTKGVQPLRYRLGYKIFANWGKIRATQITTLSESSKKELAGYFKIKEEKIKVVPLGVDLEQFKPGVKQVKDDYVFYVGQAFPRRHLKETMEAFEIISSKFPKLKLIAVGVDKYNPRIIDKLADDINNRLGEERIIRYDSVDDERLRNLYQKALLFIYISSSEAMGLPPLEALAAGTAPVVANTPTTREIFGKNALFVDNPDDIKEIAQKLKEGLSKVELRENIVDTAGSILSYYSWKNHTDSMLEMFKDIAKK